MAINTKKNNMSNIRPNNFMSKKGGVIFYSFVDILKIYLFFCLPLFRHKFLNCELMNNNIK